MFITPRIGLLELGNGKSSTTKVSQCHIYTTEPFVNSPCCNENMSVKRKIFFPLLALQPTVGLYFAAL